MIKNICKIMGMLVTLSLCAFQAAAIQKDGMVKNPKTLVVYFSHSGNTKKIAKMIKEKVSADEARIDVVKPYVGAMDDVSAQGQREVESGYMPEIKPLNVTLADYDRIVIGTPTWWYTMAPAVLTFLSNTDLSGKDVVLYMTNAGWPGTVIKDMTKAAKGAHVIATKEILFDADGGNKMVTSEVEVEAWIDSWK